VCLFAACSAFRILFFPIRGPLAVARAIAAIVVDAMDRMSLRWSAAHVSEKVAEVFAPTRADANAAPAIVFETRTIRIAATVDECSPTSMLNGTVLAVNVVHRESAYTVQKNAFGSSRRSAVMPSGGMPPRSRKQSSQCSIGTSSAASRSAASSKLFCCL